MTATVMPAVSAGPAWAAGRGPWAPGARAGVAVAAGWAPGAAAAGADGAAGAAGAAGEADGAAFIRADSAAAGLPAAIESGARARLSGVVSPGAAGLSVGARDPAAGRASVLSPLFSLLMSRARTPNRTITM